MCHYIYLCLFNVIHTIILIQKFFNWHKNVPFVWLKIMALFIKIVNIVVMEKYFSQILSFIIWNKNIKYSIVVQIQYVCIDNCSKL